LDILVCSLVMRVVHRGVEGGHHYWERRHVQDQPLWEPSTMNIRYAQNSWEYFDSRGNHTIHPEEVMKRIMHVRVDVKGNHIVRSWCSGSTCWLS
jgi:hypothetical protein